VSQTKSLLRELPSLDRLLQHQKGQALVARFRREHVVAQGRALVEARRLAILGNQPIAPNDLEADAILDDLARQLDAGCASSLVRVINATGTVLHTNLGRARLARAAVDAVVTAATEAITLEYDLERGERGRRESAIEALLSALTGAEAATVVNNNAAAVLLGLNTLAEGREVIVSRGELIEIGGAFRLPDIMHKSGVVVREVGTTNRTHVSDYEDAIGPTTALLLKVHTSNYRVVGFSSEVTLPELVALGRSRGIPVMEDLGSGALIDLAAHGLPSEPVVGDRIAMGANVVTFSGDKVLGGPQAGLIVGTSSVVDAMRKNPLHRALRSDKLTLAALEATLRLYQQSPDLAAELPTLGALTRPLAEIEQVGLRAVTLVRQALGPEFDVTLEDSTSEIGSGALPTQELPTKVVAIRHDTISADRIAARFRSSLPPVIGRISRDAFLLDLRLIHDPTDLVPSPSAPAR
jgi:L-seryl-tRNA(Ser) seleniumtransferase